jgi:hypothetical protein
MTEQEMTLIAGCVKGEKAAWDAFVLQYSRLVYHSIKKTFSLYHAEPALRLSMNIIGQRKEPDGSYTQILVSEGSVLRSDDNLQIHFETSRPAYVYILMYDS